MMPILIIGGPLKGLFFILTVIISALSANSPSSPKQMENAIVFYSFPRSGTNWTIAGLQVLTRRRAAHLDAYPRLSKTSFAPHWNRLNIKLDSTKSPIYRSHYGKYVAGKNNKIIMVLRDYRETFLRLCFTRSGSYKHIRVLETPEVKFALKRLKKLLKAFEYVPDKDRHLFFYEDLITNPENTFRGLLDFLGEPDTYFEHFIKNLDHYRKISVASYHHQHRSYSKGKSTNYHKEKTPAWMIAAIDKMVESAVGPYLFDKYLKQYKKEEQKEPK